ncbi:MAG TPA: DNA polymerase IV [Candidatus Caenarcaniphilales bacterium]|nr:DNA polymerase IV [Candidatus Caenarcaniphilales bacterium]
MNRAADVVHVDLDAFFAAVEQRDNPELRGKPVIVGGGGPNDRGVVSTCSYEARPFGVRSAMPLRTAAALCPQAIFVPVDGRRYAGVSRQVMAILRRFTPRLEQVSIDEAFLDLGGTEGLFGSPEQAARRIKQEIAEETQLSASVGVAANRLVAKIASDLRKPDGLVVVAPGDEVAFLAPLPIERLWGVGIRTRQVLADYGVATIGDLAALPEALLQRRFGSHGAQLAARARGVDNSAVGTESAAKSIGQEHTFDVDCADWEVLERTLLALSEGVGGRLRAAGVLATTVTVKIRDSTFITMTRQRSLPEATDQTDVIWRTAMGLARREVRGMHVRLLGVTATGLTEPRQLSLFATGDERRRRAVEAADAIRGRFGPRAIRRARLLDADVAAPFERDPRRAPTSDEQ